MAIGLSLKVVLLLFQSWRHRYRTDEYREDKLGKPVGSGINQSGVKRSWLQG